MLNSPSMFALAGALVSAGAYAHHVPTDAIDSSALRQLATANIRHAQVAIYCGHNAVAVTDIRAAGRQLRALAAGVPPAALAALDEAAWQARRDRYGQAERALESALGHIGAAAGNAGA